MKYLNREYYVDVKDHRNCVSPTEKIFFRKRDPPKSLRTQYEVQKETQITKNQKVVGSNGNLEVKIYPKKMQPKFKPPNCPSSK